MKINGNTPAVDIIDGHEKRIGTIELILRGFLLFLCLRSMAKIISDNSTIWSTIADQSIDSIAS